MYIEWVTRMSAHELAVIDVSAWMNDDEEKDEERAIVSRQLVDVLLGDGLFYITGHGVEELPMLNAAREFFALSDDEKQKIALSRENGWRGWSGLGWESTGKTIDWHEALDFGPDIPKEDPRNGVVPLHFSNLYPSETFASIARRYYDDLNHLGHQLCQAIARGLGVPNIIESGQPFSLMRCVHYPPLPESKTFNGTPIGTGCGVHTDYGFLTFVTSDQCGLELQPRGSDEWVSVPPREGMFACNIGDALAKMTHGVLRATPHRVVSPPSCVRRTSVAFFFEPPFEQVVSPMRHVVDTRANKCLVCRGNAGGLHAGGVELRRRMRLFVAHRVCSSPFLKNHPERVPELATEEPYKYGDYLFEKTSSSYRTRD